MRATELKYKRTRLTRPFAGHKKPRPRDSRGRGVGFMPVSYASFANFSVPSTLVNFQPSQSPPLIAVS